MAVLISGNLMLKFEDLPDRAFMFVLERTCMCVSTYLSILKQNKLEIEANIDSLREHKQWKNTLLVLTRQTKATE